MGEGQWGKRGSKMCVKGRGVNRAGKGKGSVCGNPTTTKGRGRWGWEGTGSTAAWQELNQQSHPILPNLNGVGDLNG